MRFSIYIVLLLAALPFVLTRPFFGLCVYYFVSLLQPKLFCWHPSFPDAMLVGVPMIVGAVLIGVKRRTLTPLRDRCTGRLTALHEKWVRSPIFEPSWLLVACAGLVAYISVTRLLVPTPLSVNATQYRDLVKIMIVVFLLTGLASDFRRFRVIYLVVALSVAFWAIKGGLKVVLLGPHPVYGKTYDNNFFALTSVMVLPMVFYFGQSVRHIRWRTLLHVCAALMCLAVIGSRSRAGFLALVVILFLLAWSSRYRFRAITAVALFAGLAVTLSGAEIKDRVQSILAYREDRSAQSRFYTWNVATRLLAQSPAIGVGFANFEFAREQMVGGRKAAHNIYLQNLAELGVLGHPWWLAVVLGGTLAAYRLMRATRGYPPVLRWAYQWSRGLFLGLVAFNVHGAFHNEEYLELMFVMIGLVIALQVVVRRELREWMLCTESRRPLLGASASVAPPPRRALHPGGLEPVTLRPMTVRPMTLIGAE